MIIWSGRGILTVIVLIVSFILLIKIIPEEESDHAFVISFFIAGAFSWYMGKKWNQEGGKTMIDKDSGEEVFIKPNHSLFWINMQYWGPIFGIMGLIILIQQYT